VEDRLKQNIKSYLLLGGVAGVIILVDQVSKMLVRNYLPVNSMWAPWDWLLPYARFFHVQNTGVAFGMLKGANTFFAVLAAIVSGVIIYYYPRVSANDWTLKIALGMQLAGALGNLIDRIFFGFVTDFISVGTFAIWNVADASITMGVVVLLIGVWLQERNKPAAVAEPVESPVEGEDPSANETKE
jgi:signal peptidase II